MLLAACCSFCKFLLSAWLLATSCPSWLNWSLVITMGWTLAGSAAIPFTVAMSSWGPRYGWLYLIRRFPWFPWRATPIIGDVLRDSRALLKRPLQVPLDPFGNNKRRPSQLLHFVVYSSTPVVLRVLFCSLAHSRLPLSGRGTASDSRQTPPPKATAKHCPRLTNENTLSADWRLTATEWPKHRESSWVHLGAHSLQGLSHLSLLYVWYPTTIGRWTAQLSDWHARHLWLE